MKDIRGILGITIAGLAILFALFSGVFAGHDPYITDLPGRLQPPSWQMDTDGHFLGTDQLGRDLWTRIVYGTRVSLLVAGVAALASALIGVTLGILGGFYGGIIDTVVNFFTEVQLSVPYLLVALTLLTVAKPGIPILIFVLALAGWPAHARMMRAKTLAVKEQDYVWAARSLGASNGRVLWRHVLPNTLSAVIVIGTIQVAQFLIGEATLSFLGLGVPPQIASWGSILSEAQHYIWQHWWVITFPGVAIVITVLGLGLLGDWLGERLDPRLRRR